MISVLKYYTRSVARNAKANDAAPVLHGTTSSHELCVWQVRYWSLLYQHPLSFRKTKTLLSLPFRKTGQAEKHLVQESQLIEITSVEHVKGMPVSVLASSGKAPKKRALPFRCRGANQLPFCFQIICPHSVMAIL